MYKLLSGLLLFLFIHTAAYGQVLSIDEANALLYEAMVDMNFKNDNKGALTKLLKIREAYKFQDGESDGNNLLLNIQLGTCYQRLFKPDSAIIVLEKCLPLIDASNVLGVRMKLKALSTLGNANIDLSNYGNALKYAKEVLGIMKMSNSPDKGQLGVTYFRIATTQQYLGVIDSSLYYHRLALENFFTLPDNDYKSRALAQVYGGIGAAYMDAGNYLQGRDTLLLAYDLIRKVRPLAHEDVVILRGNLALAYENSGEYNIPVELYEENIKYITEENGRQHLLLAREYNHLGAYFLRQKAYRAALEQLEMAIRAMPEQFDKGELFSTINVNLGTTYQGLGDLERAMFCYSRALEVSQNTLPPDHPSIALPLSNVAMLNSYFQKFIAADSMFEAAIRIYSQELSRCHPKISGLRIEWAQVKVKLGDVDGARQTLLEALECAETYQMEQPQLLSRAYLMLGAEEYWDNKPDSARYYAKKAIKLNHETYGGKGEQLGIAYGNFAELEFALNDLNSAMEYHKAMETAFSQRKPFQWEQVNGSYKYFFRLPRRLKTLMRAFQESKEVRYLRNMVEVIRQADAGSTYLRSIGVDPAQPLMVDRTICEYAVKLYLLWQCITSNGPGISQIGS